MNLKEKRQFINELCENVRKHMIGKSKQFPKNWDGLELRQYIADSFKLAVLFGMNKERKRNYNKEVWAKNLL
jgi:hypothetical protein